MASLFPFKLCSIFIYRVDAKLYHFNSFTLSFLHSLIFNSPLSIKLINQVLPTDTAQFIYDIPAFLRFIPKKELSLCQLFFLRFSTKYRLQSIWMKSGIPSFRCYRHWCRSKILYLFQMKIQTFGNNRQLCHIFFLTTGMAGNKIRNKLLAQSFFAIDPIEYLLKLSKLVK